MTNRHVRLAETWDALAGPLARLGRSLREDREAVLRTEDSKSGHDLLATDAFLQRFQQVVDLSLRKLFPHLLAVLEGRDDRHAFGAVLDHLDGYYVLSDVHWWITLNERRNRLVHEYAMLPEVRAAELAGAWEAATHLCEELIRIRADAGLAEKLLPHD